MAAAAHWAKGHAEGSLVGALARGVLSAWLVVVVELGVLAVTAWGRISGVWELQTGAVGLLPSWLLLAIVPGLCGGLAARALAEAPGTGRARARLLLAVGVLFFFFGVAWGVGGGRHISGWQTRSAFGLVVGVIASAFAYFLSPLLSRLARARSWFGVSPVVVVGAGAIIVLEAANALLLVRLYPAFHGALSFLALFVGGWTGATALRGALSKWGSLIPAGVTALSCFSLVPASRAVAGFDNFRWIVTEGAPTLTWGVELASLVAPPDELDPSLAALPLGERRATGGVDLRGRDILLISIDALRADHLGTYGYERPVSPTIDALARAGVVFDAAYAPTPHTSYSITSLMTGKYMRPLLLQGAGADSDLWANLMQSYDYRTAAFYPPAVFFIDPARFAGFEKTKLGFEYAKIEFAEGDRRVNQYEKYLDSLEGDRRVFSWVHLFGPHEPYEPDPRFDYGKKDIDLYDSEIRAVDETVGRLVEIARRRDPKTLVLLTSDHGEEFGDHGGRYHGTSVYDEQVRVPMIISAPGLEEGRRVAVPVQTIDLLPTVLASLKIPVPPRIRGADLSGFLGDKPPNGVGRAVAETDDYTLLAEDKFRLICQRRSGACQLFDIEADPGQLKDVREQHATRAEEMRARARSFAETHGQYESQGLRAEGKGWPAPILLGISGNADVAPTLANLLDDADPAIRRKAAELLFSLANTGQAPALRLAMTREEDQEARGWVALALTRLEQGAPYVLELLEGQDERFRRFAALALAEAGRDEGEDELIRWWLADKPMDFEMARRVLDAFAKIRSEAAVPYLINRLKDVRLRPHIAAALAAIGDKDAKPHLAAFLLKERFQSARLPLAEAILALGGDDELIVPLRRFLGVPERLEGGLDVAQRAGILDELGGPKELERRRLHQLSDSGIRLSLVVPPGGRKGDPVRFIARVRSRSGAGGDILLEPASPRIETKKGSLRSRNQPSIATKRALTLHVPAGPKPTGDGGFQEVAVELPERFGAQAGHYLGLELFAPLDIEVIAVAAVPLREDLPPPPPEPWEPGGEKKRPDGPKPTESDALPSP